MFLNIFKPKKRRFLPLYDKVIDWMDAGKLLTPQGDRYKKGTIYNYRKRRAHLELFEKEHGALYIENISIETGEEFVIFMSNSGYCKNTIGTSVAGLKSVLNILYRKGLSPFNGTGIRASKELTTAVFNSVEDIQALLNLSFLETPSLEIVRDVYVMHCFTGLRYGDLRRFLKSPDTYIRRHGNRRLVELKTAKTGEIVVIPLADIVEHILGKYGQSFSVFSYQHYNRCIKLIGEAAGLTQLIECTRTKGGVRQDYTMRKCDMMSSHAARRTFATNATLSRDFPMASIMKITGHKSISSFERYVRCNVLESAIAVSANDFFKISFDVDGRVLLSDSPEGVNLLK